MAACRMAHFQSSARRLSYGSEAKKMDLLEGIWRLIDGRARNEASNDQLSAPYGAHPQGMITLLNDRMLAALCNGNAKSTPEKCNYPSYGDRYTFDGTMVDVASDPSRIGGRQARGVFMDCD